MEKLKVKIEESVDHVSRLENMSFYILLATAFLIPLFFIPSTAFQFQFSKVVFVSLATLVAFAIWLIARLKDGRYLLPNNIVFASALVVLIVTLVSSLGSPSARVSLIGQGFEIGTWASTVVLMLVMFLFSALFRPKERVFYLYLALFASCFLIVLFHALRFAFGADFLGFGIFTNITSNLIGKWNDLGVFFGLVALLSLITLELLPLQRLFKTVLWVLFILSVLLLTLVNFVTLWYILVFFSLLYFVYAYACKAAFKNGAEVASTSATNTSPVSGSTLSSVGTSTNTPRGSIVAVLLVILSLVFLIDYYSTGRPLGTRMARRFSVAHLEVRPNWSSTLSVAKNTLREDPLFGTGPNRFTSAWVRYKPSLINESIFWNTDFSLGVGLLPTQLVTGGLLGFLSWVALILSVVLLGLRYLLSPVADKLKRYLSVSSFFGALFLWAFFIFYTPSVVILTLTFLFTGVFIASLYNERLLKPKNISFIDEPRVSFVSVLLLTALLVGVVALSYILGKDFVASGYFQRALIAIDAQNDLGTAESYTKHALALSANDLYNRLLSEVALRKLNVLLAGANSAENPDAIRTQFQTLMGDAVSYARKAVELDSTNYQNWIALGRVYEAVIPLSVEGAYEGAAAAYEKALALNPKGPQIRLIEARLELARGKNDAAIANINEALALKHNYTEAVFLLSQVQVSEGKVKEAIASVESVAVLSPTDPTVFFQLGILKYNNRDYRGALEALERAVFLAPTYSNAKYFLGLSYYRTNMVDKALTQFNDILVLNPTNTEVPTIIANLKAGRDPFANLTASERPDKRNTLPVKEPRVEETTP